MIKSASYETPKYGFIEPSRGRASCQRSVELLDLVPATPRRFVTMPILLRTMSGEELSAIDADAGATLAVLRAQIAAAMSLGPDVKVSLLLSDRTPRLLSKKGVSLA